MRYPLTERGVVSAVNGDGTMDVTVSGRAHPYAGLQVMGGAGGVNAGDMVDVGFIDRHLHGRRWMPFVISSTGPRRTASPIPTPEPESAGYWTSPFRDGGLTCWDPGTEMPNLEDDTSWAPAALGLSGGVVMGMVTHRVGSQDVLTVAVYDDAGWHVHCLGMSTGALLWTRDLAEANDPSTRYRHHLQYWTGHGEVVLAGVWTGTSCLVHRINATTGMSVGAATAIPCDLTYGYTLTPTMLVGGMKAGSDTSPRRIRAWARDTTNESAFLLPEAWVANLSVPGSGIYLDQWGPPTYSATTGTLMATANRFPYSGASLHAVSATTGEVLWTWEFEQEHTGWDIYDPFIAVGLGTDIVQNVMADATGRAVFWCPEATGTHSEPKWASGHHRIIVLGPLGGVDGETVVDDWADAPGDTQSGNVPYASSMSESSIFVLRKNLLQCYARETMSLAWSNTTRGVSVIGGGSLSPWVMAQHEDADFRYRLYDATTGTQASEDTVSMYSIPHAGHIYSPVTVGGMPTVRRKT